MSKILWTTAIALFLLPTLARADWQVAPTGSTRGAFFQTKGCHGSACGMAGSKFSKATMANNTFPLYAASINGSLKTNLSRLLARYHWKLKWMIEDDYNLNGRLSASTLEALTGKMVKYFPIRATFYKGNRVVTITARKDKSC